MCIYIYIYTYIYIYIQRERESGVRRDARDSAAHVAVDLEELLVLLRLPTGTLLSLLFQLSLVVVVVVVVVVIIT